MAANGKPEEIVVELSRERARKFFTSIANDPFLAVVVTEDGEIRVFGKDIGPDHLNRIKEVLRDIQGDD